jgi:uncharacterized paraquat-inducible protein A
MDWIPCPRCRRLVLRQAERCEDCGCPVRQIDERRRRLAKAAIVTGAVLFLLLLANSIYWATKL